VHLAPESGPDGEDTDHHLLELRRVTRTAGADGYVSKNEGPEALPSKLHALCEEIVF
jgi:hypothetical protein